MITENMVDKILRNEYRYGNGGQYYCLLAVNAWALKNSDQEPLCIRPVMV
jgi:hypothetical protein